VIKEVMALVKDLFAALVVAFDYSQIPLSHRIAVEEYSEFFISLNFHVRINSVAIEH
jgi:hypothetical protein